MVDTGDIAVVFGSVVNVELLEASVTTLPPVLASCTELDVGDPPRDGDEVNCDEGICGELVPDV